MAKLSPLQWEVLRALALLQPPFALTGGAALAGFHLEHRETRDLDLFWHGRPELGDLDRTVEQLLRNAGLSFERLQLAPGFARYRISRGDDVTVLDLVADPVQLVEEPVPLEREGIRILVDTPREILANKLCTLLGRAEIRDLIDLRALIEAGVDLERGFRDAPTKDGGFSPLMLAYILDRLDVTGLATSYGLPEGEALELDRFKGELADKLLKRPPDAPEYRS